MEISYGIAQICMSGHVINAKSDDETLQQKHCPACGEKVINKCPECATAIKGKARIPSQIDPPYYYDNLLYVRPSYCIHCGNPYPWTKSAEEAAYELIEFATELNQAERDDWKRSIPQLLRDSPKTNVAAIKFKTYALKAGNEIAKGVKTVIVDIVSESVKKAIWGS